MSKARWWQSFVIREEEGSRKCGRQHKGKDVFLVMLVMLVLVLLRLVVVVCLSLLTPVSRVHLFSSHVTVGFLWRRRSMPRL